MKCPRCDGQVLTETVRDSIHVDVCPQCRGVWLDRGELERIKSMAIDQQVATRDGDSAFGRRDFDDDDDFRGRERGGDAGSRPPERKRGWRGLLDLFD